MAHQLIEPRYLGDGVYVEVEHGLLKLTTKNDRVEAHTIYLEDEVFNALCEFVDDATQAAKVTYES